MNRFKLMLVPIVTVFALALSLAPAHASGTVNHTEFNNIYFAERKSEFENRADVTEFARANLQTNPDSYIIYYKASFSDMCVQYVDVHVWRGSDGNLYIRPWKGILKCNGDEVRFDL